MSDDDREYSEEEEEEEEEEEKSTTTKVTKKTTIIEEKVVEKTEAEIVMEEKMKKKVEVDDEAWLEYIKAWRTQRAKEESELKALKEKQAKRKEQREAEQKKMMEQKRHEEEQRAKETEAKRAQELEEKRRRLAAAEERRQQMLNREKPVEESKPNYIITKRTDGGPGAALGGSAMDKMMNVAAARGDMGKTKEQLAEEKKICLSFRIQPLEIEGLDKEALKAKAKELWESIVKLETEKYDLEERQKRQEYDLKELNERQRQMMRNKALKKGLDPEALSGAHPPKIQVASKYERRIDRRTYGDKKGLFDGGFEAQYVTGVEKTWTDRMDSFDQKKGRLPKWLGEQPGKKKGDPDEEEVAPAKHVEEVEEEEEEVEEEDEEED